MKAYLDSLVVSFDSSGVGGAGAVVMEECAEDMLTGEALLKHK